VSTNADFVEMFVKESSLKIFKMVKLESLALYWDTDSVALKGLPLDEWIKGFQEMARGWLVDN
jgi:hypothetical protein